MGPVPCLRGATACLPCVIRTSRSVGSVIPSKVSNRYRSRSVTPSRSSVCATVSIDPPRHTPHSTTAPGTWCRSTYRTAWIKKLTRAWWVIVRSRTASQISRVSWS